MSYQISISNPIKEKLDKLKGDLSYSEVLEQVLSPRKLKATSLVTGKEFVLDELSLMTYNEVTDEHGKSRGIMTLREFIEDTGNITFEVIQNDKR